MNGKSNITVDCRENRPALHEEKCWQRRGVITWGDREYEIDEFRSLVLSVPHDKNEEHMIPDGLCQPFNEEGTIVHFSEIGARMVEGSVSLADLPQYLLKIDK